MNFNERETSDNDGCPERLFLFTMGTVSIGYVNSASPATYAGNTFSPLSIDMDEISQALAEDSPTINVQMDAAAEVASWFIAYQPVQPVRIRVLRHHVEDVAGEYKSELIGDVMSGSFNEQTSTCTLSVRMLASNLDRKVPWPAVQKQCNYVLYGPGCRVNRDDYKTETTVAAVQRSLITSPDFLARAEAESDPRWFVAGYVIRVSNNDVRWIIAQTDDVLTLQSPFVGLQAGEDVIAYAGCDLLKETCKDKFNNLDRHLAFPWGPQKNPFTDNLFGYGTTANNNSQGLTFTSSNGTS